MGKKKLRGASRPAAAPPAASFVAKESEFEPTLNSLFSASLGPVRKSSTRRSPSIPQPGGAEAKFSQSHLAEQTPVKSKPNGEAAAGPGEPGASDAEHDDTNSSGVGADVDDASSVVSETVESRPAKKRKRRGRDDDVEDQYMQKLARDEAKEAARREHKDGAKRRRVSPQPPRSDGEEDAANDSEGVADASPPPRHETIGGQSGELEKAARTVFLGNVSTATITSKSARKTFLAHLSSQLSVLADHTPPHKVESLRFRSTPFASAIPKRAAFAKKELMDATTKSTNAYAVYSTREAAREAVKRLNGTVVLDRHLRIDDVAHPAKVDHRRCVFVGNLGFVDDDSIAQDADGDEGSGKKKKKQKVPADVEEGLWREFGKAGIVESVRVVRDAKTRVGKGFAYVQFTDENAVEAALLFNDKKYPPMLPRKLRVTRAKSIKRKAAKKPTAPAQQRGGSVYRPKVSAEHQSLQGRAGRLFGKAGAAQLGGRPGNGPERPRTAIKPPEAFVFEGQRATSQQKPKLKMKKSGKPQTRSSRRGAAWRTTGANKHGK